MEEEKPSNKFNSTDGNNNSYGESSPAPLLPGTRRINFPDPDPTPEQSQPYADDVTRLNATPISREFLPRNLDDIQHILKLARQTNTRISSRGTKHSMGAQSICKDGYILSMKKINQVKYDPQQNVVIAGAGALWTDVIVELNSFGKSPRTMQSYSSFSVGGSLSVNAHGITTDETISESVIKFDLVKWNGQVIECQRGGTGESGELFSLALGGYGLFGIIYQVTLKVDDNVHLDMEVIHTVPKEFPRLYEQILKDPLEDIELKLARLDITNLEHIELFLFRRASQMPTVSLLSYEPRSQDTKSRLIYKWLAPTMQELRFKFEREMGFAMDWSDSNDRNLLMFESADSLAQLSTSLFKVDDTFILQEYFVPRKNFLEWLTKAKPIYEEISNARVLTLLNTTIRFVHEDKDTVLRYASHADGMYAFVLYYRIQRTQDADQLLHQFHQKFVEITQEVDGTFYLPYRHHYTHDQVQRSYPFATTFFHLKEKYDPHGMFDNVWFQKYGIPFCSKNYQQVFHTQFQPPKEELVVEIKPNPNYMPNSVSEKRSDSYRKLFKSPSLRKAFLDGFLKNIFNIENRQMLYRMIAKAVWDPRNENDLDIFSAVQEALHANRGVVAKATTFWKQVTQLREQKQELTRETVSLLGKLGKVGQLQDYLSIGDSGKLVLSLRNSLGMKGKVWILHDQFSDDIPAILERGTTSPVGIHQPIDYSNPGLVKIRIPDEGVDLVTLNQGLHHFPQNQIMSFLKEIFRVLRPGGIFILREHNATPDLIPMLDLAHSVFNACLEVPRGEEKIEIRAFRPLSEWKEIVQASGLVDSLVYEVQKGDPTEDEMMCFFKPPLTAKLPNCSTPFVIKENAVPDSIPPQLAAMIEQAPSAILEIAQKFQHKLLDILPKFSTFLKSCTEGLSSGQQMVLNQIIDQVFQPLVKIISRFDPFFKHIDLQGSKEESAINNLIPSELFLIIPALKNKVKSGKATPMEMGMVSIFQDLELMFFPKPEKDKENIVPLTPTLQSIRSISVQEVNQEIKLLFEALPELKNPNWPATAGFSSLATMTLKSKLSTEPEEIAKQFASMMDSRCWEQIQPCIAEIRKQKVMPHTKLLFGDRSDHISSNPWGHALIALLGSPKVYFKQDVLVMMGWAGLSPMVEMWKLAQALRRREKPEIPGPQNSGVYRELEIALGEMEDLRCHYVEMKEGQEYDIPNVKELTSATFGYYTLTTEPHDVTALLNQKFMVGSTLKLKGARIRNELGSTAFNTLRKAATFSTNTLALTYYSHNEPDPATLLPRVELVLQKLAESGALPSHLPSRDNTATWYKLSEWMQVEMIQKFGESLNDVPWYRFPFMKYMGLYFETLRKEFGVVSQKYGTVNALMSKYLLVDVIPGIAMAWIMGQLQVLALPLLATSGAEYDENQIVEHMLVKYPPSQKIDWASLDRRVKPLQVPSPGLILLQVPTFKSLGEIIIKLATFANRARILQISKQKELQVKVSVPHSSTVDTLSKLHQVPGCKVMFTFQYPQIAKEKLDTHISLNVSVLYLLSAIRFCQAHSIKIEQIYDTF